MTKLTNTLCLLGLVVAVGCALAALGAGLGYRFEWWHYGAGIATLAKVFWVAAGTASICAIALVLKVPRDQVLAAAQAALASMGLDVVDANAEQGRIEATATSLLFGFKDDVVVRISEDLGATKVDVRSKSRVGRNDLGMNAKRIRVFQSKLKAAVR